MIFCIDPGHHRSVKGKRSPEVGENVGIIEYQWALECAHHVCQGLKHAGHVAFQTMHESDETNKSLAIRRSIAAGAKADALVSIHCNAAGPGGWYPKARGNVVFHNAPGTELATLVAASFRGHFGDRLPPRRGGVLLSQKPERKGIVEIKNLPAVLIESAFMTHKTDAAILAAPGAPFEFSRPIVAGLIRWANRRLAVDTVNATVKLTI